MAVTWLFDGDESPRQFETRKQLAHALGVSSNTVRAWLAKGLDGDRALGEWRISDDYKGRVDEDTSIHAGKAVTWTHLAIDKCVQDLTMQDVLEAEDAEPATYPSALSLSRALGITNTTMYRWIELGYKSTREAVTARHQRGNVVYDGVTYLSINHMAQSLGIKRNKARSMLHPDQVAVKPKRQIWTHKARVELLKKRWALLKSRGQ